MAGFLVFGCQHHAAEPLVPAAGTVREVDQAVDDVSIARCDYEQRCSHIGPDMRYASRDHCMNVMRSQARGDFNQCHAGVDQKDLRECLTQIANEDCTGALRQFEEYKECHMDDLCKD
jgi:hypothetical protein